MAKASKKVNTQKPKKQQAVKPKITKAQFTKKSQLKDVSNKKSVTPKTSNVKIKKTPRSSVKKMVNDENIATIMTGFNHLVNLASQALQLYITKHQSTNNANHNVASDDAIDMPSDQSGEDQTT